MRNFSLVLTWLWMASNSGAQPNLLPLPPKAPAQSVVAALTNTVTLAWDRSPDASVTGYKIYWGNAEGQEINTVVVGNTNRATLTGLPADPVYFRATAYNALGEESEFSNEAAVLGWIPVVKNFAQTNAVLTGPWRDSFLINTVTNPATGYLRIRQEKSQFRRTLP